MTDRPIRLALVDDYEVVLNGVARMFEPYRDRIAVVEIDAGEPVSVDVDIALLDTFAQHEADNGAVEVLVANPHAARVVVYTWIFHERLIDEALALGVSGYLSKTLPACDLVVALEAVQAGEVVVSEAPRRPTRTRGATDWPGRAEGLTEREAEILAFICQGRRNAQIAELMYLSINSIKTYIRSAYRKIGVTSRTQAVLWGLSHGFSAGDHGIDRWRVPVPHLALLEPVGE